MTAPGAEREGSIFEELRASLPPLLPAYLARQRWFGGKARRIHSTEVVDFIPLQTGDADAFVLVVRVEYQIGSEEYFLPMLSALEPKSVLQDDGNRLKISLSDGRTLVLMNALQDDGFSSWLLDAIEVKLVSRGVKGEVQVSYTEVFQDVRSRSKGALQPRAIKGEQSNSSIIYGEDLILKFIRRVAAGINPELEIGRFLTEKAHFPHVPPLAGSFEYRTEDGTRATLGILQGFVPNQGDAWKFTLASIRDFWTRVSESEEEPREEGRFDPTDLEFERELSSFSASLIGSTWRRSNFLDREPRNYTSLLLPIRRIAISRLSPIRSSTSASSRSPRGNLLRGIWSCCRRNWAIYSLNRAAWPKRFCAVKTIFCGGFIFLVTRRTAECSPESTAIIILARFFTPDPIS